MPSPAASGSGDAMATAFMHRLETERFKQGDLQTPCVKRPYLVPVPQIYVHMFLLYVPLTDTDQNTPRGTLGRTSYQTHLS